MKSRVNATAMVEKCGNFYGTHPALDRVLVKFCDRYEFGGAEIYLFSNDKTAIDYDRMCALFGD